MKLGTETGSLVNHIQAGMVNRPEPQVGMAATMLYWTDRAPATIVKVTASQVHVQEDRAIRTDRLGMTDSGQEYVYEADPTATVRIFRKTNRGWKETGSSVRLAIGRREKYHDFSF